MQVIAVPEVRAYLRRLSYLLYEEGYFGFEERAQRYVEELFADIKANLPFKPKKPAPPYFSRYGQNLLYASFRKNRSTQWYVFFNLYRQGGETVFLIRYIGNNHVLAQYL